MIATAPVEVSTALYRFYDANDDLLYVGITVVGQYRWVGHRRTAPWWPDVARVTVEHHPTLAEAKAAETAAIRDEHPRFNVIHRDPPRERRPAVMRPHGAGSIYQRADRPHLWIASGPNDMGRPAWEFPTEQQAQTFLAAFIEAANDRRFRRKLARVLGKMDR